MVAGKVLRCRPTVETAQGKDGELEAAEDARVEIVIDELSCFFGVTPDLSGELTFVDLERFLVFAAADVDGDLIARREEDFREGPHALAPLGEECAEAYRCGGGGGGGGGGGPECND